MKSFFSLIMMVICLFGLTMNNTFAQTDSTTVENKMVVVTMENGEKFKGEIEFENDKEIILIFQNDKVVLDAARIKKIEYNYLGEFDFESLNKTRYFFTASAIPLGKSKNYYQNIYGIFNFAHIGITKNLSIGGGFDLFTALHGDPLWFVTPKIGFEVADKIHLGVGGMVGGFGLQDHISAVYGVGTFGDSKFNITTGLGVGFYDGKKYINPAFNISVMYRITNQWSIMSENYLLLNEYYFCIHGLRWMVNKNSFDFGATVLAETSSDNFLLLPYIAYARSF